MMKKAQVYSIVLNKASKILLCHKDYLQFDEDHGKYYVKDCIQFTHFYFTINEDIKKGDWYIKSNGEELNCCESNFEANDLTNNCRKIIATTNPDLWYRGEFNEQLNRKTFGDVPKIGDDFIQAYITAYNEQNIITEVMLEYEEHPFEKDGIISIKTRPNSTVIIHPAKEMLYTREEVINSSSQAFWAGYANGSIEVEEVMKIHDEWIDKNYSK